MKQPELVVVPFDKSLTDGDSSFNPAIFFPYTEGMTLEELKETTLRYFMKEFGVDDEGVYESTKEFAEDEGIHVTGGWVIEKSTLDIIDVVVDCGSDSACYAVNRCMKMQVQKAARLILS